MMGKKPLRKHKRDVPICRFSSNLHPPHSSSNVVYEKNDGQSIERGETD